jgi:2-phospho-L-lactate guanylyltransferase
VSGTAALLVPLKSFTAGKGRLGDALDTFDRAELVRTLAAGVLAAAGNLATWVVCDDAEVAAFAIRHGAQIVWRGGGLNRAVQSAFVHLGHEGFDRVVVAHGDLAGARSFSVFVEPSSSSRSVVIAADRHGEGTNVISVPTSSAFRFAYGPGSFQRHRIEAVQQGLDLIIADVAELGLDVDTPEDLALYRGRTSH